MVGLDGLEPSTSRLSGARSSHLSYRPLFPRWFRFSSSRGSSSPTPRSKAGRPFGLLCSLRAVIGCDTVAGGDDGVRTHDPLLAGQVLSQLSYTPDWVLRNHPQKLNSKRVFCYARTLSSMVIAYFRIWKNSEEIFRIRK